MNLSSVPKANLLAYIQKAIADPRPFDEVHAQVLSDFTSYGVSAADVLNATGKSIEEIFSMIMNKSSGTSKLITYGGIALLLYFLLKKRSA